MQTPSAETVPDVAVPETIVSTTNDHSKTTLGEQRSITFVEDRNGEKIKHEGFFYEHFDTYEACKESTEQLIDSIPNKHLIGGYKIEFNEALNTYAVVLLGQDGKQIDNISTLFNP